jgi:hypothetical protein
MRTKSLVTALGLAFAAGLPFAACTKPTAPVASSGGSSADAGAIELGPSAATSNDGGAASDAPYEGPMLAALFPQTPVMSDMEWPTREDSRHPGERIPTKAVRLGYIRQGGRVPVVPEAHPQPNCPDGWYELLAGGFVCGKYATLDMNHPRVKMASHPPYVDQVLPYQYGFNLTNGTPLYKTAPSREDRLKFEPWLKPRTPLKLPNVADEANPYENTSALAQRGPSPAVDAGPVTATAIALAASPTGGPALGSANDPLNAFDPWDSGVPWYLREYDGGKPNDITLDDLREATGGPIVKRMVKGFYLALDKEVDTGPNKAYKWWRTTSGLITPLDRIVVARLPTDFHGVWLDQEPTQADLDAADAGPDSGTTPRPQKKLEFPVGFLLWLHAHKYTLTDDHKKATQGELVRRFTAVQLTGQEALVSGYRYAETDEGWWMRQAEGTIAKPGPVPTDLKPGEKWIDVNLKTQTLIAFEGDKPVFATLVSTGRMDDEVKEKDHRTKPGSFRIREKHIAATMDGDVASDGPYSIEDVPWIMYFNGSIALHGAFWHQNFGHVQSHGCVNLSPVDARSLFGWTDPKLPAGWHGVMATDDNPGTRVVVHDPPEKHPKWEE